MGKYCEKKKMEILLKGWYFYDSKFDLNVMMKFKLFTAFSWGSFRLI
jgi:hypothetical protein